MNAAVFICIKVERLRKFTDDATAVAYEWRSDFERETGYGTHADVTQTPIYAPGCKYLLTMKPQGEA